MDSVKVIQIIILAGGTIAFCLWLRPGPTRPAQPVRPVHLQQVYPLPESQTRTDVDIIAIHGLDTNSEETWVWDPKGSNVNWLKQSHMLPKRFPTARIFTCDWPADLFEEPDFIQKEFEEFARLLLAGIKHRPPAVNSHAGEEQRPIIFIASCLGGIILMKTLAMASHEFHSVKQATRGIVFLATPFRGTSFQDVAKWAEPGLRSWASIRGKKICNLLEFVKSTFNLGELVRSFTAFCQENGLTNHVFTFYETGKSSLPRKIAPWLPASLAQEQPLVNISSATLDIVKHPQPLDRPHVTMNKFYGPDDAGYIAVAGVIECILCEVRQGRPIEKADLWIRNKRYSLRELKIERLSGDLLPMDRCYINLAIVERLAVNASRAEEKKASQKTSPFSLLARLKTEPPDKAIEVILPSLFEPRQARDGEYRRPSRILIRGRAGVGKTTLCKKLIHDFTYGEMWQGLFDRVLWVPLRNLKRRRSSEYNLRSLFHDEYFSQHRKGKNLAEALWCTLEDSKSERTLFILDGLDEVSQDLYGDMLCFFKELLDQPNIIITSRPHAILPTGTKDVDLQLETIGFYPDQLKAYVEKAFTDSVTGKTDSEKVAKIESYLQQHQIVQGLVRIPVLLDALCFTWESFSDQGIPQTMTAAYQAIEHSLWKKDAVKLGKFTEAQIQDALPREITSSIANQRQFLEFLAFTGIYNDVIEFEPKHCDAILDRVRLTDTTLLLNERLGRLSFLRTSDPSLKRRDQSYHFLHLTFQEYFAARYFVRQWIAKKPLEYLVFGAGKNKGPKPESLDPTDFIGRHKYKIRYDIFWRFVAGLLDAEDDEEISRFFVTVEHEPLDILGPAHQRLVMHCLSEIQTERKELEERLLQWLLFECKYTKSSSLAAEVEFPVAILDNALRASSEDIKIIIMKSLQRRPAIGSGVLEMVTSVLDDDSSDVRLRQEALGVLRRRIEILTSQSVLTPETLEKVAAQLEDTDRFVRYMAVEMLTRHSALTPEILEKVAAQLEDKDEDVRRAAVEILALQSALTPEILEKVAAQLEDKDGQAAVEMLTHHSALTPEILEKVAARLEDEAEGVRRATVQVFIELVSPLEILSLYLDSFYRALLHTSFTESFGWFNRDGLSYIVVGDREVCLGQQPPQFTEVIRETQRALGAPIPH
ncbi:hypothetical protein BDW75DRAFT_233868 [Aspergillus navahoensis]